MTRREAAMANFMKGYNCSQSVVLAFADMIDIDEEGHVAVNGVQLEEESYISEYAFGLCDLDFPYEVPVGSCFVLGDNRDNSTDSRATNFGCISEEEMVGKVLTRVWPLNSLTWYGF